MPGMDIFNGDAFSTFEMAEALDLIPYRPTYLQNLGLFEPRPIRTLMVGVEQRENTLNLVPITPRGAPKPRRTKDRRNIRNFNTVRVALADTLYADELQSIRAFGTLTELDQVMDEVMRREMKVRDDIQLTKEHMRLGAIQGLLLDADGSTIVDWYAAFGISAATEIDFDLDAASPASGAVRRKCNQVIRQMTRAAEGAWIEGQTYVVGLCGDAFWDDLTAHTEIEKTYLNWQAAQDLRNEGFRSAWSSFRFGEITWVNYRGTDDGSTVAVGTDKCKFFPVNARGCFQEAMSPGESLDVVNTLGREFYPMIIPDRDRNEKVDIEVASYPLFMCTRPAMLQSARRT